MQSQNDSIAYHVLPLIVLSQFGCTSLWFAGNAILSELTLAYSLPESALGYLTSSVQFGFIIGTLLFAILTIADRFAPSKVFFVSATVGALFNLAILFSFNSLYSILTFRFLVGICLAGIYPVGMKIASDYYNKGLGKSLGYLVGALVLGTAFPHILKGFSLNLPWQGVLMITSGLALTGGTLILIMGDGPHRQKASKFDPKVLLRVFTNKEFRAPAFGYFGHMWELYTFWAFVPIIIFTYLEGFNVSFWSFAVIGIGTLSCIVGGYLSERFGAKQIAFLALSISAVCCLLSAWVLNSANNQLILIFLFVWGIAVIMDSPLFSTLVAQSAPSENKGTALTIVNSIGFLITIFSIQLLNSLILISDSPAIYMLLAIGPILGLFALSRK
ncbi:MAG: MFS transporter [Flammeovirgaceae bacterium]|nr:MFS transporter [Flammeovirgaceae bacterium]MBE60787.1 MFS transporter [Flammeovirgaceae bacterium]HCX22912.1 MFS transporter [Cytophagales bacterium]|tara:strand:+ start:1757 stop:2917 length:1161 start_codon:yes stop_codon:yes gene_type:complete